MTRSKSVHRLTCDIDRETIEKLDSIVEQDDRFWNRTHLINDALKMCVTRWESKRKIEPTK